MSRTDRTLITSRKNPVITETAKLSEKKYRQQNHMFCFEGRKLLAEALDAALPLVRIFCTEAASVTYASLLDRADVPVFCVSDSVYEKISLENAPEGLLIVAKHPDNLIFHHTIYKKRSHFPSIIREEENSPRTPEAETLLVCESLRDPGNLGTVVRTAAALGIGRLVLSSDSADLYNPKTVRAAMGALFRMPIDITDDLPAYLASLKEEGYTVFAAALHKDAEILGSFPVNRKTVFVIGNEGHGLSEAVIAACGRTVLIPMQPGAESLNASVAAALLMWECVRA